jgi:hypothetical protein
MSCRTRRRLHRYRSHGKIGTRWRSLTTSTHGRTSRRTCLRSWKSSVKRINRSISRFARNCLTGLSAEHYGVDPRLLKETLGADKGSFSKVPTTPDLAVRTNIQRNAQEQCRSVLEVDFKAALALTNGYTLLLVIRHHLAVRAFLKLREPVLPREYRTSS